MAMIVSNESLSGNSDRSSADSDTAAVEHESELPAPQRFPPPSHEAQMPTVDANPTELTLTNRSNEIIESNKDNEVLCESMASSRAAVAVADAHLGESTQQPSEFDDLQNNHDMDKVEEDGPSDLLSDDATNVQDLQSEEAVAVQATSHIADAERGASACYTV